MEDQNKQFFVDYITKAGTKQESRTKAFDDMQSAVRFQEKLVFQYGIDAEIR